ncbi:MAG: hypothetical protein L3J21_00700 [Devosiaceae bacterium]|nr:hypothetical protein [Devosiaceae bacterium]
MVVENIDHSEEAAKQITVVVFASDQGPGDAERTAIMSQVGNILAKQKARIICLAQKDLLPLPLLTSAHLADADIELVCDKEIDLPASLKDIDKTIIENPAERHKALAQAADCFIGLPGSLASATSFFLTIADLGASKPMVFLNKNRAYEILRGISVDVFAHSFHKAHRNIQFVESVGEIWPKVEKLTG